MDALDGIKRIAYRPALNGNLGENIKIGRMIATANDVYILDSSQGRILRMYRSGSAYELDVSFICGPVNYGEVTVGKLVDISLLPSDNVAKASVMGVDATGNILFCSLTEKPAAVTLAAPDSNWGSLSRMIFFQDNLYLLDVQNNQLVRFQYSDGLIDKNPHQYFGNEVPHLADVVDIAIDQEFLYILHADGSMATCSNTGTTTTCSDPVPYGDNRAGQEPSPLKFSDSQFILMQASQPPDPSLYVLDGQHASIYHLSLRKLNLQDQFRPQAVTDYPPKGQAVTAFLITPNRRAILAAGNQLYFGLLP